jgi:MFS transporter, DHA1 family, multidrug resistance protein
VAYVVCLFFLETNIHYCEMLTLSSREVVWMASIMLVILLLFMPETSGPNILLRRAQRLRRLTGSDRLQSQGEIDQRDLSANKVVTSALVRPMEIMLKDPSIFFVNVYTGYFYGVYYTVSP